MNEPALDHRAIHGQIAQLQDLPPLPQALQLLIQIIHDETASAKELESVLKYDQGLSAKVLRIANSSFYGLRNQVTTLSRAIMTVGYFRVRALCLSTLLMGLFSGPRGLSPAWRESFWKHAFSTARIAAEIAHRKSWVNKEQAYILGLLHDLGRSVMAVYLGEHYRIIHSLAEGRKIPMWCAETQYGLLHTQVGKWVAIKWAFPEVFRCVMEFHHIPQQSPSFGPEVRLVNLADVLAHSAEYTEFPEDEYTLAQCRALFITEEEWNGYQDQLGDIWLEADQLWDLLK